MTATAEPTRAAEPDQEVVAVPELRVIGAGDIGAVIESDREGALAAVRAAYLAHHDGDTVNPHSSFLRFPERARDRIIALPAFLGGQRPVSGIKWIASYPGNTEHGIPRASAMLVLNDYASGYPYAVLESSLISATRTAGSAVLAAEALVGARRATRVGVVGTGLIAEHVRRFLRDLGWAVGGWNLFDTRRANAERFAAAIAADGMPGADDTTVVDEVSGAFLGCDLVVLATVAGEPHVHDPALLAHAPVVLHLSLRDLAPEVVLAATNITDDVDHAVRERTSLHLAEQVVGHRDFVHGTIAGVLRGEVVPEPGRAVVFAPFGLGVLDLAVGGWAHDRVTGSGGGQAVPDFYRGAVG
ncbi:2,3-diaminopropionate biosynthesis protein SbnB [Actinokineospora bangkokensis]|uniref:2,3-diaminopropionate biosynthesis protein SbnB n=1 Tax=Actinokineospora bangkokensis TaxID=1193682 RepID=A0A1Q9LNU7_9PSEU|nr:2,3-diaminopropionate biosynthesis protein SbnB [Actinokineospora bangkokensis]OLR93664.1 2,3-diaminopropionate biosynthesis protein SbnB [Actinokineospora bangkokensis]